MFHNALSSLTIEGYFKTLGKYINNKKTNVLNIVHSWKIFYVATDSISILYV